MEKQYKLDKIRELAGGDKAFIEAIIFAFLDEVPEAINQIKEGYSNADFKQVYQNAHKIKPTIEMFDLPVYDEVIKIQDWGKFQQSDCDISLLIKEVEDHIKLVSAQLQDEL